MKNDTVTSDSSEALRQNKKFSLVVEPVGMVLLPGMGAAAGFFLTPDDVVEGSYQRGEIDAGFVRLAGSLMEVRWKHFFANSFYMNTGLGYQTLEGESRLSDLFGSDQIVDSKMSASTISALISIGNQWQWDTFTIGCDWIGVIAPIVKGKIKSSETTESADPEETERARTDFKVSAFSTAPIALRLYLGIAF